MSVRVFGSSGNVALRWAYWYWSGFCHSHHDALTCRK